MIGHYKNITSASVQVYNFFSIMNSAMQCFISNKKKKNIKQFKQNLKHMSLNVIMQGTFGL